jgi:hypothetical protein
LSRKPNRINVMDDTQALLKILALADREIETGETVPIEEVIDEIRNLHSGASEGVRLMWREKIGKGAGGRVFALFPNPADQPKSMRGSV